MFLTTKHPYRVHKFIINWFADKKNIYTERPSIVKGIFSLGYPCVKSTLMSDFPNPSPLVPLIWHADNLRWSEIHLRRVSAQFPQRNKRQKTFVWTCRIQPTTMEHFLIRDSFIFLWRRDLLLQRFIIKCGYLCPPTPFQTCDTSCVAIMCWRLM